MTILAETVSGLQPYPAYKPSGVEWLGKVPEHWEVRKLKSWLRINEAVLPEDTDPNYAFDYVDIGAVGTGFLTTDLERIRFRSAPSRARRVLRSGDTIVSTVRTYLKAVWSPTDPVENLIASTGFAVLTPPERTASRFVGYLCQSAYFADRVTSESVGIAYPAIAETRLGALEVCVPPLSEQAAIARYLDHADRRIRRCIQAKEKLVKLVEEQRQTLVNEAITGRVDIRTGQPYPAYKPSGVEWLGEVPEHWQRARLKTVLRPIDRRSNTGTETLLSLRRDHGIVVYAEHFARPSQSSSLVGFKLVTTGQLVVNRLQANNGLVFCSRLNGLVSPDYSVFEMRTALNMEYLSDLLRTPIYRAHFRREATGLGTGTAGFLRLYDDKFLETPVFLPSEREQVLIRNFLAGHAARVGRLIDRVQRQIRLFGEFRIRLIADIVTGKLDIRGAAARLPEWTGGLESLARSSTQTNIGDESNGEVNAAAYETEV